MDSINNSGLNRFLGIVQQGARVVEKRVIKAAGTVTKVLPGIPIPVPLMQGAKVLVQAVAPPADNSAFPEHPPVHIENMFKEWSPERIDFVRTHCMKPFEECEDTHHIESPDKVFVARSELGPDISVTRAREFGFILPKNINPNLRIIPLMIRCFGVGSGSTLAQIQEGARNILASQTDRVAFANAMVLSHIQSVRQRLENPNVLVVPFITGFSLGGMFASAIAVKNNITSMVFNGLGLGKDGCDFVGQKNWAWAQQHPNSCIAMFVDHDFVASPNSPWRSVIRIPGRIFRIPRRELTKPTFAEMSEIHFYKKYFDQAYQEYLTLHPRAGGRLVA
ncbi:MAG: hypothetical protein LBE98_04085 [Puniceicoccales bacterium]|jgi:hypothetical protein|nr:hypothetical protein [Puniceicoccales bacterium]